MCFDTSGLLGEFVHSVFTDSDSPHGTLTANSKPNDTKNISSQDINESFESEKHAKPSSSGDNLIRMYDMNTLLKDGKNLVNLTKTLNSPWTPILHKLGSFKIMDYVESKNTSSELYSSENLAFGRHNLSNISDEYEAKCTLILVDPD